MSLADQLAARTTLDSTRLANSTSLKHPPSFIFTPRHAATLTIDDLHSLALNAWEQLASIDSFFEKYQNKILGQEAKRTDRGNLTKEENDKLDRVLEKVLRALGRHILTKPAGVVLEWLVRRFRVNDLNLPSVVALFLPYHTTSHFPSALALLPTSTLLTTPFSAFIPAQQSLAPVPLPALIALLPPFSKVSTARALLDFVLKMPIEYLEKDEKVHRALIGFWLQVLAGYLERAGSALPVGEQVAVLSTLLEVLKLSRSQEDLLIAVYILLTRYSAHYPFDGEKLRVVQKALVINQVSLTVMGMEKRIGESEGRENVDRAMMTSLVVVSMLAGEKVEVKDGKRFLGNSGWKSLMRIDGLAEILISICCQYQAEKFMNPFLTTLVAESLTNSEALTLLSDLFNPIDSEETDELTFLPSNILTLITRHLILKLLEPAQSDSEASAELIKLLSNVYQRNPEIWTSETSKLLASLDSEGIKVLRSIITRVLGGGAFSGAILESESSYITLRILALKDVITNSGEKVDEDEMMTLGEDEDEQKGENSFVHDVLLARLGEPVEKILEMLLTTGGEGIKKVQALLSPEEILTTLVSTLATVSNSNVKSAIVIEILILNYLSNSYIVAFPSKKEEVLKRVWWNRILKSKVNVAKALPSLSTTSLGQTNEWVKGMTGESNEEIVGKIGKNLAGLEEPKRSEAIDFLLNEIRVQEEESDNQVGSGRRLLSLLVSAQLIARLDSTSKISFATRVLNTLALESFGLDSISSDKPESILGDAPGVLSPLLVQAIYAKSTFYNTLRRTRAALVLITVASIQTIEGSSWSWLAQLSKDGAYAELLHSIYRISHTGTTPGTLNLASKLLQSLFTTAISGGDILSFLASVWTTTESRELKVVALNDAATYVLAMQQVGKSIDFQLLLPATLLALEDVEKKVRIGGLELLRAIQSAMPTTMTEIYGKGLFYGAATSGSIKYLDVADAARYITKLLESHVEFSMDGKYIVIFHQAILGSNEPEVKKKASSLKSKVFHYLLSHVTAWPNVLARTGLLRAVSGIVDGVKSALVVPVLNSVVKSNATERKEMSIGLELEMIKEYAELLLGPYQGVSKKWLESTEHSGLDTFLRALDITDDTGIGAAIRKDALVIVKTSLFSTVRGETRLDLFKRLARLSSASDSRLNSDASECLRACKIDHDTVAGFLNEIRLAIATPVAKGAKRGRTSQGHSVPSRAERIPELVIVLESVDFKMIRASHALVLTLFDLLSTLIEISASAQIDIQYSGQLVLYALSKTIENVNPTSGVTADSIRMAPVLDLMRSTVNPQTSHQALLLLAQLGPLVPDQLAHNIMPIFTFMGANVLQRDDAYSLRVVDRTLESIVPALVSSMKASSADRDSLLSDLKKLLRVFTDAATHVPRHRRIKLFVRFVQTLGAADFLSTVAMLLVDKSKSVKGTDPTSLPLSIFENFPVEIQLTGFKQIVQEISRLLSAGIEGSQAPFLDIPTDSTPERNSENAKEQIHNLINFLALSLETKQLYAKIDAARAAGTQSVDTDLSELVASLLEVSNIQVIDYTSSDKAELSVATGYALQATVHLMSTQSFSEAVLWLLNLPDQTLQSSALALLRNRLPTIKPTRRGDISPAVISVVERVRISLADSNTNLEQALVTLEVVANSVWSEEDAVLAKSVPELLVVAGTNSKAPKATKLLAMAIIKKLANRLGPRLIPLAAKITPFAVEILRFEARDPLTISHNTVSAAFEVLEGLFTSIPTFIGTQLDKVLEACLSSDILSLTSSASESTSTKARAQLLSTAAKKVPAKALYPSIIRLHSSLDLSTKEPLLGLLDILNRALRQGKTTDIAENYRPVFKLFLTVFDIRRICSSTLNLDSINQIEENALGAFVQFILKLNEQTFRPLFLRTYDWAVIDLANTDDTVGGDDGMEGGKIQVEHTERRIVLFKLVDRLLAQLKSIVVPYFSFMLDQTVEILNSYAKGGTKDITLWTSVISALTKSLIYDESGFWTPLRLSKLSNPIASQIESPFTTSTTLTTTYFHPLLSSFSQSLSSHDTLLKSLNSTLLMFTRSDNLKTKRNALESIEVLWLTLGDTMVGFVPETTPFLAETLEEIEGGVELVTRRLVGRIEEHLGESLQSFLEN